MNGTTQPGAQLAAARHDLRTLLDLLDHRQAGVTEDGYEYDAVGSPGHYYTAGYERGLQQALTVLEAPPSQHLRPWDAAANLRALHHETAHDFQRLLDDNRTRTTADRSHRRRWWRRKH
ncbi:hypothetical protein [Streptomyces albus]|uniref:hypothetical protein n=1 Tax=Streptomyces sp. NRRL F-5917 TaxID=1463873 RepID=UPI0004C24D62|nr:hypothetical protein [Streptomyces sp. NRRL F-5917]